MQHIESFVEDLRDAFESGASNSDLVQMISELLSKERSTSAIRKLVVEELYRVADEAPVNGNELAQTRVRMAANLMCDF